MGDEFSSENFADLVENLSENEKLELITLLSKSLSEKKKDQKKASDTDDSVAVLLSKPMRPTLDLEELAREQNYRGGDQKRFDRLAAKLNITEPVENLIAQLTP
jgi:hypothetical protein